MEGVLRLVEDLACIVEGVVRFVEDLLRCHATNDHAIQGLLSLISRISPSAVAMCPESPKPTMR